MDDTTTNIENDMLYIERMLNENVKNKQIYKSETFDTVSVDSGSSSMIPPHRYRFQHLKSHKSNIRKSNVGDHPSLRNVNSNDTSEISLDQIRTTNRSRSKWCGGSMLCFPTRQKKDHLNKRLIKTETIKSHDHIKHPSVEVSNDTETNMDGCDIEFKQHNNRNNESTNNSSLDDRIFCDEKNSLLMKLNEKIEETNVMKETIISLKEENAILLRCCEELKETKMEHENTILDLIEQQNDISSSSIDQQIKEENDDQIDYYTNQLSELKRQLDELKEKHQLSTLSERLLMAKGEVTQKNVDELKQTHLNEIAQYKIKIRDLENFIDEKNKEYSHNIKKMASLFDGCKNSHTENMDLHDDLEYILTMVESSLIACQKENENLKTQSLENTRIINSLMDTIKEKSVSLDLLNIHVHTLSLEKFDSYYHLWTLNFEPILHKLMTVGTSSPTITEEDYDNDEIKKAVSTVVDGILDDFNQENNNNSQQTSLSVTAPPNDIDSNENRFELHSVVLEHVPNESLSHTENDQNSL